MFHGHIGAMDVSARALLIADAMITDGRFAKITEERYAGWNTDFGKDLLGGKLGLDAVAARVLEHNTDTRPVSGRQEHIENLLNSFI
jgi:xylose isomerase